MRKAKRFKVKYVYIEPKTPEEKAEQQRKLDQAFDMIFNKILKDDLKK
jgi:hypothetical protein